MAILGDTKAVSLTLLDGVIGNLNPKTTNVYTLGTSSLKWNNIYATETHIDKLTLPTTALNTPSLKWANSGTDQSRIITTSNGVLNLLSKRQIRLCPGNEIGSTTPADDFQAVQGVSIYTDAFVPIVGGTMNLGSSDDPWLDVYSDQFNGLTLTPTATGFTIAGGTASKTLTVNNTYTLGAACAKGVTDNSSATAVTSSDTNLITGRTLYYAGYVKSSGVTSITLKAGAGIALDTDNTAITSTGTRTISISGMNTSSGDTTKFLNQKGSWSTVSTSDEKVKVTARGTTKAYLLASTSATSNGTAAVAESNVYLGTTAGHLYATAVHNAVWNDYAEYRAAASYIAPGRVVVDTDNGEVILAAQRLQPGAQIVSDTWGHIMGETEQAKTPIAVAGRVLVYPYRNRNEYHAGMAVCSAPNGTVDIMTRDEIRDYPDCIVGIVSEIPNYEEWGTNNVKVDGRIWVRVR